MLFFLGHNSNHVNKYPIYCSHCAGMKLLSQLLGPLLCSEGYGETELSCIINLAEGHLDAGHTGLTS
jgi:hypothetical protein